MKEGILEEVLRNVKKLIPKSVFNFFQPAYHSMLAYGGAVTYGFPSRRLKVIGVTGTKGKSTVVHLATRVLEAQFPGKVAACGSLGFKIKDKEWPNTLKMTMPGRFKLHKLMAEALKAGCEYFVLEVTSEGIKQKRHLGINFDCAVFTNLHKEHIESHGSFEKYYQAKQELFELTDNMHVINVEDPNFELFSKFPSRKTIFYGLRGGDIVAQNMAATEKGMSFEIYGTLFNTSLAGEFNVLNCLAALSVGIMYGLDLPSMKPALEAVKYIPGRMEFLQKEPFKIVVDYAHTPDSLEAVYRTLKSLRITDYGLRIKKDIAQSAMRNKLICILGAAGGGRDKWKRPEFGRIAAQYCDEIILTDEDPYEENPALILDEIKAGFSKSEIRNPKFEIILDRKKAIQKALSLAKSGDTVVITGKGSETSMAIAGNRKIPWSDKKIIIDLLGSKS